MSPSHIIRIFKQRIYKQSILKKAIKAGILLAVFAVVSACSGGGGGGSSNSAPTANSVSITDDNGGDAVTGDVLSGSYTYNDADGDGESGTTFQWLRDGVAISGATEATYTLDFIDVDEDISVEVTPAAVSGESPGSAAASSIGLTPRLPIYTNFQEADVVIGQSDFLSDGRNQGGSADANSLSGSIGQLGVANGILYMPDSNNNRVLGFNMVPSANNSSADFVLGQPDFTTTTAGVSATKFFQPRAVTFDNGKMFMSSAFNNRVLIWNTIPASGGVAPDVVLGQPGFLTGDSGCSATNLNEVEAIVAINDKLIVSDASNNRILIWNSIPTVNNTPPDLVLGQQDFDHCALNDTDNDGLSDGPSAQVLNFPAGIWSDGTRLVVADSSNHRILIWSSFPTTIFAAADLVLGQSDFVSNTRNDDNQNGVIDSVPSDRTLSLPNNGIYFNGTQLFVPDRDNNRVLIWNSFPASNFVAADIVLGQSDFAHGIRNDDDQDGVDDGDPTARTFYRPSGIFQSGRQLILNDSQNNRTLIFNGQ